MPFLILSGLLQLALIVHVMKTGRDTYWIYLLFMIPVLGPAAYLIVEVGPEIMNSPRHRNKIRHVLNPNHNLNTAEHNAKLANTFETRTKLAQEQISKKQYDLAENNYQEALRGLYEFEPYSLTGLARCQFHLNKFSEAKASLDTLKENNPDFRNQDAHLLYARILENLNDVSGATEEYEALIQYYTGPEPQVHFADLLAANGNQRRARELLEEVVETSRMSAKHYTKMHKEWINLAKRRANELSV